jgi:hypothetical protein
MLGVLAAAVAGCGTSKPSGAQLAVQQAFLGQVHDAVPNINGVRSDAGLIRLGQATCTGFASGESFQSLADRISGEDDNLPLSDLGTVMTAAAEHLCPKYSNLVS